MINRNSEAFSKFPQVYAIGSESGVEIGFSVTIHEDDYYDTAAKQKNRAIIPLINAKLPDAGSATIGTIQQALETEPGWILAEKTRNGFAPAYPDLQSLIAHLKSGNSSAKGGGAIYRILDFEEAASTASRVEEELSYVLTLFRPLMQLLQPTSDETQLARNMGELAELANDVPGLDPGNDEDGRKKVLREVAVRQGQPKFRENILEAYGRRCAISGCNLEWVLQAAHISPYNGVASNHVSNGLPLRADLHTLFDLGLIMIDSDTRTVSVSSGLVGTEYEQYSGVPLLSQQSRPTGRHALPSRRSWRCFRVVRGTSLRQTWPASPFLVPAAGN